MLSDECLVDYDKFAPRCMLELLFLTWVTVVLLGGTRTTFCACMRRFVLFYLWPELILYYC